MGFTFVEFNEDNFYNIFAKNYKTFNELGKFQYFHRKESVKNCCFRILFPPSLSVFYNATPKWKIYFFSSFCLHREWATNFHDVKFLTNVMPLHWTEWTSALNVSNWIIYIFTQFPLTWKLSAVEYDLPFLRLEQTNSFFFLWFKFGGKMTRLFQSILVKSGRSIGWKFSEWNFNWNLF